MSELDKKLKTIVMRFGWITEDDDWQQAVEDIKKAFTDAGYEDLTPLKQLSKNTAEQPEMLTGAEWYEKTMAEAPRYLADFPDFERTIRRASGVE